MKRHRVRFSVDQLAFLVWEIFLAALLIYLFFR